MPLPSGTVTFLFTDIEGSTRLWEEQPAAMRLALARHDEIADATVREFGGVLVKRRGEGDSLFAVFDRATDAVSTAAEIQRTFAREPWPDAISIKVRMAIHTGEADIRDGDYYGPVVNRCARLRAIAHGDQTILSASTYALCRDTLPPRCTLALLGEHRLRDLGRPEIVFQLQHPDLPSTFPALRSLDNMPNNLPQQVTSFIGRGKELAEARRLLDASRLLTLTGTGGCGKTRIALQLAADVLETQQHGVWLVELGALADPSITAQAVAGALGLKEEADKPVTQTLVNFLRERQLLLALDNCEHLLEPCATLAEAILRSCPQVTILSTSREALGVAGEQTYRIPSMSLPEREDLPLEMARTSEAVALFAERARLHQSQFQLTRDNLRAIVSICQRLDGIPLAIELAAARVRSLAVDEIDARLHQRFQLLSSGTRSSSPRQQTLRSLIDWSYDLLTASEQKLFRRLSVFSSGWTLNAAERVCAGEDLGAIDVLGHLESLVDKNLVLADTTGPESRYRFLETVREYASELLSHSDELPTLRHRHVHYFWSLCQEADRELLGANQGLWLSRLDRDLDNVLAAHQYCDQIPGGADLDMMMLGSLRIYFQNRGLFAIAGRALAHALNRPDAQDASEARSLALFAACVVCYSTSRYDDALTYVREYESITQALGDRRGRARALQWLGTVVVSQGDNETGISYLNQALEIARELDDRLRVGYVLGQLGECARLSGDLDAAYGHYSEALAISRELKDASYIVVQLINLAQVVTDLGRPEDAKPLLLEAGDLCSSSDLRYRGQVTLDVTAGVAASTGCHTFAARILGASDAALVSLGSCREPADNAFVLRWQEVSRSALGREPFELERHAGRSIPYVEALSQCVEWLATGSVLETALSR